MKEFFVCIRSSYSVIWLDFRNFGSSSGLEQVKDSGGEFRNPNSSTYICEFFTLVHGTAGHSSVADSERRGRGSRDDPAASSSYLP